MKAEYSEKYKKKDTALLFSNNLLLAPWHDKKYDRMYLSISSFY